jgi:signal transduction histidine kinase
MKSLKSLRTSLRWFLLGTSVFIILIYTLFLGEFFSEGLRTANTVELSLFAREYEGRLKVDPAAPPPVSLNVSAYTDWSEVPLPWQGNLQPTDLANRDLEIKIVQHDSTQAGFSPDVYFLFPYQLENGQWLYVTRHLPAGSIDEALQDEFNQTSIYVKLTIAITILLLVMIFTQLFYRAISKRILQLLDWTETLSLENVSESSPDMGFDEFNNLSQRLHGAYIQLEELTRREKDFLNHASHELRTPIAVIRNNMELIKRNEIPYCLINPVERINRASDIMQSLTETLLLLSKGSKMEIPKTDVNISEMLNIQIDAHEYLLKDKNVIVEAELSEDPVNVRIEKTVLGIVTANLLRNAYQHTYSGIVKIHVNGKEISIFNKSDTEDLERNDSSNYQIGLKLCHEICESFGWDLYMQPNENGMQVRLTIT